MQFLKEHIESTLLSMKFDRKIVSILVDFNENGEEAASDPIEYYLTFNDLEILVQIQQKLDTHLTQELTKIKTKRVLNECWSKYQDKGFSSYPNLRPASCVYQRPQKLVCTKHVGKMLEVN